MMLIKVFLILFVQVLTKQMISAQCIPACNGLISPQASPFPSPLASGPISSFASPLAASVPLSPITAAAPPIAAAEAMGFPRGFTPSFKTGFPVQSASPVSGSRLLIKSENAYEGPVLVAGSLPFLSAVAIEGTVPSSGAGGVLYGCAGEDFGIVREEFGPVLPGAGVLPGGRSTW